MSVDTSDSQWNFIQPDVNIGSFESIGIVPVFYLYVFIAWSIVWFIGIIFFIIRRKNIQISIRSPTLVIISAIGAEITLLCNAAEIYLTHKNYPCFLDLWYILSFFPLYFVPFVLRFLRYFITMIQIDLWKKGRIPDPQASVWILESTWVAILSIIISFTMGFASYSQHYKISEVISAYGCNLSQITFIILIVLFSVCIILVSFGLWFMRKIDDPYHMKQEIVICFILWMITLLPFIALFKYISQKKEIFVGLMFLFVIGGYFTSVLYPIILSLMHPPENNSPDKILDSFEQIALDKEGFEILQQVAIYKYVKEIPPFIREVILFKSITEYFELHLKAQEIYETFIKDKARLQINISSTFVQNIQMQLDKPTSDMFNESYREVMKLLNQNFLFEVKNRPEYAALLEKRKKEIETKRLERLIYVARR